MYQPCYIDTVTVPTTQPAPEPREPINIPWDIIGIVVLSLIALCVLGFIATLIIRKLKTARNNRVKLQREIMAAFTAESTNPVNTLKYPLYRAADHPVNRAYVNAMMTAYKEQDALNAAITNNLKRKPELISTVRFEEAVQHTAERWDKLNYEAKKIGSPLIDFTTQRKANNLLKRALDEDNYATERDAAMSRLIQLLEDARTDLKSKNNDDAMLVDVTLDALSDTQRNYQPGGVPITTKDQRLIGTAYPHTEYAKGNQDHGYDIAVIVFSDNVTLGENRYSGNTIIDPTDIDRDTARFCTYGATTQRVQCGNWDPNVKDAADNEFFTLGANTAHGDSGSAVWVIGAGDEPLGLYGIARGRGVYPDNRPNAIGVIAHSIDLDGAFEDGVVPAP